MRTPCWSNVIDRCRPASPIRLGGSASRTLLAHSTGRRLPWPKGARLSICCTVCCVRQGSAVSASTCSSAERGGAVELAGGRFAERAAERGQLGLGDLEARGRGVAAVAFEMLAALGERRVQVESGHAAGRADAGLHAQRVEGDDDRGQVVLVGEPAGDDADDAGMPLGVGQHQRRVAARVVLLAGLLVGGARDAALERLPLGVELFDVLGELLGAVGARRW